MNTEFNPEYNNFLIENEKARFRVSIVSIVITVIALIVFGVLCAFFVFSGIDFDNNYKNADKVNATVSYTEVTYSGDDRSTDVYVNYEYMGKEYQDTKLASVINADSYKKGDTLTVYLIEKDPGTPQGDPNAASYYIMAGIFGAITVVLILILIAVLGLCSKHKKNIKEYENNRIAQAKAD